MQAGLGGRQLIRPPPRAPSLSRRVIALYIAYALLAGLAVLVAVGTLLDWPALTKPLLLVLLVLLVLAWLVVAALTAVLR